ncbi:MAG: hypothetical protein ILA11_10810 [Butyrivibrio sp.]|nr:hypothetical protein [Butyrivibrio sp.]
MQWDDVSREFPASGHTMFSPSQPSWMKDENVDDIASRYYKSLATDIGTAVHDLACKCIDSKIRFTLKEAKKVITLHLLSWKERPIPRGAFDVDFIAPTFVSYVNDALGFMMDPEVKLLYSRWCGGTADSILYDQDKHILRIHDLKTGVTPAKFEQLRGYAALFFLQYGNRLRMLPGETDITLRIYQAGETKEEHPSAEDIVPIMDSIMWHSDVMDKLSEGR